MQFFLDSLVPSVRVHYLTGHSIPFIYSKLNLFHHEWSDKAATEYKNRAKSFFDKSDYKVVVGLKKVEFGFKTIELQVGVTPPGLAESGGNIYLRARSFGINPE